MGCLVLCKSAFHRSLLKFWPPSNFIGTSFKKHKKPIMQKIYIWQSLIQTPDVSSIFVPQLKTSPHIPWKKWCLEDDNESFEWGPDFHNPILRGLTNHGSYPLTCTGTWEPILQVGARLVPEKSFVSGSPRHGVLFLVDPFIHLRRGYERPQKLRPGRKGGDSPGGTFLGKKTTCQVIQAVTFSSPIVGGHQQHLKGSLNHPKKVTKNCQV